MTDHGIAKCPYCKYKVDLSLAPTQDKEYKCTNCYTWILTENGIKSPPIKQTPYPKNHNRIQNPSIWKTDLIPGKWYDNNLKPVNKGKAPDITFDESDMRKEIHHYEPQAMKTES